jgi:hypothetical protein
MHDPTVSSADGYRAAFGVAESHPAFTDRMAILADKKDGVALTGNQAPFQLILTGERQRWRLLLWHAPAHRPSIPSRRVVGACFANRNPKTSFPPRPFRDAFTPVAHGNRYTVPSPPDRD